MNVAIVGSRNFTDYNKVKNTIIDLYDVTSITSIVSGGARGADTLAEKFANEFGITKTIFHAEWKRYGRGAGMIRNSQIIENSDVIFAFWDGISEGTKNSINRARKLNKIVHVIIQRTI